MRKYAFLEKPLDLEGTAVVKIMFCDSDEGVLLFLYDKPDANRCAFDRWYENAEEACEEWNALLDARGWIGIEDPLPGCQQDAFLPIRVKGREAGKPEWGKYEILRNGVWEDYDP